jgi:DMSO/TMAO reductase YedYZ molybdopterin-dependent catalytic subunit
MDVRVRQGGRRVNLALGVLLVAAALSGLGANTIGVNWPLDLIQIHAAAALGILLLAPWKSLVVRRGLRRPRRRRPVKWLSLTLLAAVLLTIASGLVHSTGHLERVGPLTLMQIHVGAAVLAGVALVAHFVSHPVRPRRTDLDRRALLRAAVTGAGAAVAVAVWDGAVATDRRFTGSVPRPAFDPRTMPVTSWIDDRVQRIEPARWTLRVGGKRLDLAAVLALPHDRFTATLDCTSGWYAEQEWEGVRLDRLLAAAGVEVGRSVEVRSATGYIRWFEPAALDQIWLGTRLGGRPLSYGHGYPARIVAPGRRGFWWVKWVTDVHPSSRPAWTQSVFPLT